MDDQPRPIKYGIPFGLALVAFSGSTGALGHFSEILSELDTTKQIGTVLLLVGLIMMAVCAAIDGDLEAKLGIAKKKSISTSTSTTNNPMDHCIMRKPYVAPRYPVDTISKATTDKDKFKAVFPMLRNEIVEYMKDENELIPEAAAWIEEMMEYSVPGGKLNRGTTVLNVYNTICTASNKPVTDEAAARACVLGWAIEFLQAFFLVADDVMDDSQTRRGQPCWYKVPKVGLIAINDSFLLESFTFQILRTHFAHEPYYTDLVELMLDVTQKTEVGQLLDLTSQPLDTKIVDLSRFTMERYQKIVKYKTAFYSFYLPVAMGMLMSGIRDAQAYDLAKKICCIMGEYFQIQDDYLDCFGDPAVIGKVGTDIQDNKCSWLVVQALDRCNETQRKVLEQNYGVWDDDKVNKVKELYRELKLQSVFEKYEEESYAQIQAELDKVTTMPRDVFQLLLNKIYKRSK